MGGGGWWWCWWWSAVSFSRLFFLSLQFRDAVAVCFRMLPIDVLVPSLLDVFIFLMLHGEVLYVSASD